MCKGGNVFVSYNCADLTETRKEGAVRNLRGCVVGLQGTRATVGNGEDNMRHRKLSSGEIEYVFSEEVPKGKNRASCHAGLSIIIPGGIEKHVRWVGQPDGKGDRWMRGRVGWVETEKWKVINLYCFPEIDEEGHKKGLNE